jgi:hypothetical protein
VDFDGDGIMDILTGCWPGELYFFKGEGKGKYAAGVQIKDKDGKAINLGGASTVFACDWRGAGKLDLLVGNQAGDVHLVPNEGTRTAPAYGKAQKLEADGKTINTEHGDSHPIAADWDKDGKLDLIVGTGAGSVMFYRNIGKGKGGEPQLAAAQTLVPILKRNFEKAPGPNQWGVRAKICVTDWNGDGWPDLLVGDFNSWSGPPPKLTDADRKAQQEAQEKLQAVFMDKEYIALVQEQVKLLQPPPDETAEARATRAKRLRELEKSLLPIQQKIAAAQKEVQRFFPEYHYQGNVWLFLRRPPEAKSSPAENADR